VVGDERTRAHRVDRQDLWWGLAWTAVNVGVIAMILLLASSA
jgi:hypothetical protein